MKYLGTMGPKQAALMKPKANYIPGSLKATMAAHIESMAMQNYSVKTQEARAYNLFRFMAWCEERAIQNANEVSRAVVERYQKHLFYHRTKEGRPLSANSQRGSLSALLQYFRFCVRQNLIESNPASDIAMPKHRKTIPHFTLTTENIELLMRQPNTKTLRGIRDRTMLEVFWATGIRRMELCNLSVYDVRQDTGTVFIKEGKGRKDRMVPVSKRALEWVKRYLDEVRPRHLVGNDDGTLFLNEMGSKFEADSVTNLVSSYVKKTKLPVKGGCHLLRHASATAMLEGGADVRFVQELLGHASLETTQIYTRVTISKLKEVYAATHPSASDKALDDEGL